MHKAIKIFVIVIVFLGVLSGIFLLTAKKKPQPKNASQTSVANKQGIATKAPVEPKTNNNQADIQKRKELMRSQWNQCNDGTMQIDTNLIWNVQILEGIPIGGTYAKGNLDSDANYPVRMVIKSDSQNLEKIKSLLVVGKTVALRGNCTEVATDGAVVLEAF